MSTVTTGAMAPVLSTFADNGQKQGSSNTPQLYNKLVGLNQFTVNAVTQMEAERLHGQLCNNEKVPTTNDIKLCTEMLITQKDAVKGWAKTKLIKKLIVFAKKRNIPHPTDTTTTMTSLPQLEEAWASNEVLAESIWWVLFGEFDMWHNWEVELEEAFMKEYKWVYIGFSEKKRNKCQKGCVAKVIVWQKAQLVKYVNWATLRSGSHGKSVSVMLPQNITATQGGKQKFRRKKGTFYEWMARAHERQNADGEDPADDEMASKEETTDIAEIAAGAMTMNTMKNSAAHEKVSHVRTILSNDHNTE